jgi:hypothetical protein
VTRESRISCDADVEDGKHRTPPTTVDALLAMGSRRLAGVNGDGLCPPHAFTRSSKLIFAGMPQFPANWHAAVSQLGKVSVSVTALGSREFRVEL